jgi:16S rRNA (cytidine1402-2'-O)-methyltransferase
MLALAVSGLNGQNFAFVGYVPSHPVERAERLRELESIAIKTGQTQLFIETPYRNTALLQTLVQSLHHHTRLATASGLTMANSTLHSDLLKQWKSKGWTLDNATPTVFAIGR